MEKFTSRAELEHLVVMGHKKGLSVRQLARKLRVSRNTVRDILEAVDLHRQVGHDILARKQRAPRASKVDEFVPQIEELIKEYPDATGQRVFEELQNVGYKGGISILRERLRELRPKPKITPVVRIETDPGEQGQMDWSPYTLKLRDSSWLKVLCFSYILAFSRRQYIDFTLRRDFYTMIRRHHDAFTYFGGVPEHCLYDGEKTVLLRWEARKPIFNPAFLSFITHYGCRPVACGPNRPQTKGKVEAPFKYIERNLLNARTFTGLEDLRSTARWWLANRSDTHIHDTTHRTPLELFMAEEKHALQPLPLHPYDSSEVGFRVCTMDGMVKWVSNQYSVPYEHVGDILTVKATETEIVILSPEIEEVARHTRLPDSAHGTSELPEHRADSKKVRYGLEPVRDRFLALGDATEKFLGGLVDRRPRNAGYHARQILVLKETYSSDDIHRALCHAMRYQAYDCMAVARILKAKARPRTLEERIRNKSGKRLRGILPRVDQRALSEYQSLLSTGRRPYQCEEASCDETGETPRGGTDSGVDPDQGAS